MRDVLEQINSSLAPIERFYGDAASQAALRALSAIVYEVAADLLDGDDEPQKEQARKELEDTVKDWSTRSKRSEASDAEGGGFRGAMQAGVEIAQANEAEGTDEGKGCPHQDEHGD